MKLDNFPTLADYFNYYLAGFCWLACCLVILVPQIDVDQFLVEVEKLDDGLVLIISGIFLVIIPYIIGFALTPLAELLTRFIRWLFGDPRKIVVHCEKGSPKWSARIWKKKKLSNSVLDKSITRINHLFDVLLEKGSSQINNWHDIFFFYVLVHGKSINSRVVRTRDLMNFTESILIPLPLFFIFLAPWQPFIPIWGMWIVGIVVFVLLACRYLTLRKYLTMQIYRAMLVLTTDKKQIE